MEALLLLSLHTAVNRHVSRYSNFTFLGLLWQPQLWLQQSPFCVVSILHNVIVG